MFCVADAFTFVPTITNPLSVYHPRTKGCLLCLRLQELSAQLTTPIFSVFCRFLVPFSRSFPSSRIKLENEFYGINLYIVTRRRTK